jgi:3-dehydroquinate synthase class II
MQTKKSTKIIVDIAVIEEMNAAFKEILELVSSKRLISEKDSEHLKKVSNHLQKANLLFKLSTPFINEQQ